MAARNSIKLYAQDGIYHLYNRGVNKADIFLDNQDFFVFCSYLKVYLLPKDTITLDRIISSSESSPQEISEALKISRLKNFSGEFNLIAYALLPNHFHLLIKQTNPDTIDRFINALGVRYASYFNHKYKRVGPLFQGRYKAVLIESDEQLLHVSRYIHLNPFVKLNLPVKNWGQITWPFSLPEYFGQRTTSWIKPDMVLNYFRKGSPNNTYESFMAENIEAEIVAPLAIDFDSE